ncbi:MAG: DUF2283 domain-containing protein [Lacisediminihabitans sp.]
MSEGKFGGTYDADADAAYFSLAPDIKDGDAVRQDFFQWEGGGEIILDFDADNRLLGVEVIGARAVLRASTLRRAKRIG